MRIVRNVALVVFLVVSAVVLVPRYVSAGTFDCSAFEPDCQCVHYPDGEIGIFCSNSCGDQETFCSGVTRACRSYCGDTGENDACSWSSGNGCVADCTCTWQGR